MYFDYWMIAVFIIFLASSVWILMRRAYRGGLAEGTMNTIKGMVHDKLVAYNGRSFVPYRKEDEASYITILGFRTIGSKRG